MKKFITLLILTVVFFANAGELTSVTKPLDADVTLMQNRDLRTKALQNVLEDYNSPLAPYSQAYVSTADKYDMDWRLLPSIAGLESSFGKRQMPGSHNSYGWGGGHIYFDSYEHGIDVILKALKEKYAARGARTIDQIAPIYAESPTWAPRVKSFVNKFEAEYTMLKLSTLELTI